MLLLLLIVFGWIAVQVLGVLFSVLGWLIGVVATVIGGLLLLLVLLPIPVGWGALAAVPGLIVLLANGLWCGALLGLLSARFRDLPQIVGSLMQVAFFATPATW